MKNLFVNTVLRVAIAASLVATVNWATAQTTRLLFQPVNGTRDDYTGVVGYVFKVGQSNVVVSHLGTYDSAGDGLAQAHSAGIFTADGSALLGAITNTAGTGDYLTNEVRWVQLDPPLLLSANTTYLVGGSVTAGSGDPWADFFADGWTPTWNTAFIGTNNPATTTQLRYSGGGDPWPTPPLGFWSTAPQAYGNVHVGYIEVGPAKVGVATTNVAVAVGNTVNVTGFGSGEATISYQWYKSPGTLLTGKTNPVLSLPSVTLGDSGTYYLTATNGLGGSQSANVVLTVSAVPAGVSTHPTNVTAFALYPVTMSVSGSGTAPLYYQWQRNGTPVIGATNSVYSFTADLTRNGDVYNCIVSNYFGGTPYTAVSSNSTLTVIANVAQPANYLHGARANTATNNFTGSVGGVFRTGGSESLVTHLGYYASQFVDAQNARLEVDHNVGIFSADGSELIASVIVPAGTNAVLNGYMWTALPAPLVLSSNTTYLIAAEVFAGIDPWAEIYVVPDMNSYYVGANGNTFNAPRYGGGAWPTPPLSTFTFGGGMYSAPNIAILPLGAANATVNPTNVTQYVGFGTTFNASVAGQAPTSIQWYKSPSTLLPGQTNSTLNFTSLLLGDSGDYYAQVINSLGTNQTGNATLTVIPTTGPIIVQQPESQTNYIHQSPQFSVVVSGPPVPFSYQWSFNGSPIVGATNATLTFSDVALANQGNYSVSITNAYGSTNSATVSLTVLSLPSGTYGAAILETKPLVYLRFSDNIDVLNGLTNALNVGTLGTPLNSFYEGFSTPGAGPQPPTFTQFESTNQAVVLDGGATQVRVPPINLAPTSRTNATIATWVYLNGPQQDYTGIVFTRNAGSGSGIGVRNDTNAVPNMLQYHWANQHSGFDSQIYVPQNQWVFIALVIQANQGTLYMHDGAGWTNAVNVAAHGAPTFGATTYVGWDEAAGAGLRQLNGTVDEVMMFGRALSSTELDLVRQGITQAALTITPSGNNVIVTWPGGGTLQQAGTVTGPYADVLGATSPHTNSVVGGTNRFYRLKY